MTYSAICVYNAIIKTARRQVQRQANRVGSPAGALQTGHALKWHSLLALDDTDNPSKEITVAKNHEPAAVVYRIQQVKFSTVSGTRWLHQRESSTSRTRLLIVLANKEIRRHVDKNQIREATGGRDHLEQRELPRHSHTFQPRRHA